MVAGPFLADSFDIRRSPEGVKQMPSGCLNNLLLSFSTFCTLPFLSMTSSLLMDESTYNSFVSGLMVAADGLNDPLLFPDTFSISFPLMLYEGFLSNEPEEGSKDHAVFSFLPSEEQSLQSIITLLVEGS